MCKSDTFSVTYFNYIGCLPKLPGYLWWTHWIISKAPRDSKLALQACVTWYAITHCNTGCSHFCTPHPDPSHPTQSHPTLCHVRLHESFKVAGSHLWYYFNCNNSSKAVGSHLPSYFSHNLASKAAGSHLQYRVLTGIPVQVRCAPGDVRSCSAPGDAVMHFEGDWYVCSSL